MGLFEETAFALEESAVDKSRSVRGFCEGGVGVLEGGDKHRAVTVILDSLDLDLPATHDFRRLTSGKSWHQTSEGVRRDEGKRLLGWKMVWTKDRQIEKRNDCNK